ncbi:MAG: dimethylargininase [Gemmatimonadetes bacterium]|nr:dimethylargininase [Gemmatimonadota bacterium]
MLAITREISPAIAQCELTHLRRVPIDLARARAQHLGYEQALAGAGCAVERLGTASDLPDSVFVEDIAVVVDECAVIMRPGAASRRREAPLVAEALGRHRRLVFILPPATIDGGDVLVVGRRVFVGRSARTSEEGAEQLRAALGPAGYDVRAVPVRGCLHLKSAVTAVSADTLLINRAWVPADPFADFRLLDVDPTEPYGANAVLVDGTVIYPAAFPHTRARLEADGLQVRPVEMDELAKAEGAATCCSLILR